jgi:AraC-like DNA-binding protein
VVLLSSVADLDHQVDLRLAHVASVERVIGVMHEQLDRELPMRDLADVACLSAFHFSRVFRTVTGIPPGQFLTALRLERAKRLLLTSDLPVTYICFAVGYTSLGTFTTRFTELVGVTPSHLRRLPSAADTVLKTWPDWDLLHAIYHSPPTGITGRIIAPAIDRALIFVGLFPTAIPQRRPIAGTLLTTPGQYQLPMLPDGIYYPMAAALPVASDPLVSMLPPADPLVGRTDRPLGIPGGRIGGEPDITLRPPRITDPPVLIALPALLLDRLTAYRQAS